MAGMPDKCGPGLWPDVGNGENPCCYGSALDGPGGCTCWQPVFDVEQAEPRTDLPSGAQESKCADCAYRPGSPERSGDPHVTADAEQLRALAETGARFWCHQGMRRPTLWRHPSGATVPGLGADYRPPIVEGVPYKADGTPGDLCAGWMALRLHALQRQHNASAAADARVLPDFAPCGTI